MEPDIEAGVLRSAKQADGLSLEMLNLDDADAHAGRLVLGVMFDASIEMMDELFEDLVAIHSKPADVEHTWIISQLPRQYRDLYDELFVRQLAVAAVDLFGRLTDGWQPPSCVAQELLLRLLLDAVEVRAELFSAPFPRNWRPSLEENLFEDLDHEMLSTPRMDGADSDPSLASLGIAPMDLGSWFTAFNPTLALPPYLLDVADPR